MKTFLCTLLLTHGILIPAFADIQEIRKPAAMTREESVTSPHGVVLKGSDRLDTLGAFRPPMEISIVAKTDSTDLRIAYAADQIIFNWAENRSQLRVDGGPADGQHQSGTGQIPINKYVNIRWVITPKHQALYVDDELRFEHSGDYSELNKCVSVFPAVGAKVTVKSIKVKQFTRMGSAE